MIHWQNFYHDATAEELDAEVAHMLKWRVHQIKGFRIVSASDDIPHGCHTFTVD